MVRVTLKLALFIFLRRVSNVLVSSGACIFSRLSCSACSLLSSTCLFTSMTFFSRSAFLQIAWRPGNYAVLDLSSCLLNFMDVLLESVCNLSWVLLSFGLIIWTARWLGLIYTVCLVKISFRLSFWRGKIGALWAAIRMLCDSLRLIFRVVNWIWRAFSRSVIGDLIFQIVSGIGFFTRLFISPALTMGMRRSSFNFVCCKLF